MDSPGGCEMMGNNRFLLSTEQEVEMAGINMNAINRSAIIARDQLVAFSNQSRQAFAPDVDSFYHLATTDGKSYTVVSGKQLAEIAVQKEFLVNVEDMLIPFRFESKRPTYKRHQLDKQNTPGEKTTPGKQSTPGKQIGLDEQDEAYSSGQIAVMIMMIQPRQHVCEWKKLTAALVENVAYYREMMAKYCGKQMLGARPPMPKPLKRFADVLDLQQLPFKSSIRGITITKDTPKGAINVPFSAGSAYLRKHFYENNGGRSGLFEFLRLQPEIRMKIYEMVFAYSRCEILVQKEENNKLTYWAPDREVDEDVSHFKYMDPAKIHYLRMPPAAYIFRFTTTCKQIYAESWNVFYKQNAIYYPCVRTPGKGRWLSPAISKQNLVFVQDLHIDLSLRHQTSAINGFVSAMAKLSAVAAEDKTKDLRTLRVTVYDEYEWFCLAYSARMSLGTNRKIQSFDQIRQLQAVIDLAYKAKTVVFNGNCPRMEAFIRAGLQRKRIEAANWAAASVQATTMAATTTKKRKRGSNTGAKSNGLETKKQKSS